MSDYNNNYNAPQYNAPQYNAPQYAAPAAPAAPEKKPFPVKLVAIAAVAVVAIIILIAIIAGGVPGDVKDEIADSVKDNYGYEVKGLDVELKVKSGDAAMYVVSGKLKGECDEDFEDLYGDYEKGYCLAMVLLNDGEVLMCEADIYEEDEKDDMKDDIEEVEEEYKDDKKEFKEELEEMCKQLESLKSLESAFSGLEDEDYDF